MQVLICCEARHVVQGPGDGPHQDQVRRGAIITFISIHQTSRSLCGHMMVQAKQMENGRCRQEAPGLLPGQEIKKCCKEVRAGHTPPVSIVRYNVCCD